MPGKRKKAPRVGKHADEARQKTAGAEGVELHFDAFLLIEKPPSGTELDFSCAAAVLKRPGQAGE